MEELKFRAWLKGEKKMVKVDYCNFTKSYIGVDIGIAYHYYYFKDIELLQFTGIYDKFGKPIYEGDIVKYDLYVYEKHIQTTIAEIRYENGQAAFIIVGNGLSGTLGGWVRTVGVEIEVIGNIYENPELLEVK